MPATFALTASTHPGNAAGRKLIESLLEGAPEGAEVCLIGAAHGDDPGWLARSVKFFKKDLGYVTHAPRLSDPKLDVKEARRQIETSAILWLDGGDTLEMVRHANERGLADAFKVAAKNAWLIAGISGGACTVSDYTIGYDDDEGFVAPCLSMGLREPLDVHDEPDWPEMRALLELAAEKEKDPAGIVIPTGGVLMILPDGTIGSRGKPLCERRRLAKDGKWRVEKLAAV